MSLNKGNKEMYFNVTFFENKEFRPGNVKGYMNNFGFFTLLAKPSHAFLRVIGHLETGLLKAPVQEVWISYQIIFIPSNK